MELSWQRSHDWRSISRAGLVGWLVFYALFLLHAVTNTDGFLVLDHVNLVVHEAGHFFFGWFGYTVGILGGTLGELLVPLLIAVYFFWRRDTVGTAFAAFWVFENFLYIGTYMADARTLALPLVGAGDHDWEILFGQWVCRCTTAPSAPPRANSAGSAWWPASRGWSGWPGAPLLRSAGPLLPGDSPGVGFVFLTCGTGQRKRIESGGGSVASAAQMPAAPSL